MRLPMIYTLINLDITSQVRPAPVPKTLRHRNQLSLCGSGARMDNVQQPSLPVCPDSFGFCLVERLDSSALALYSSTTPRPPSIGHEAFRAFWRMAKFIHRALEEHYGCVREIVAPAAPRL